MSVETMEHSIPFAHGTIRVRESRMHPAPDRAVLLLPGPIATSRFFRIPVPGYDAVEHLTRAGFSCFAVDLPGSGESSGPEDGRDAGVEHQVEALHHVIRGLGETRALPRIDVVGESWGGALASQLSADAERIRSCVMVSVLYRSSTPLADQMFRSPGFRAFLDSLPDGYMPVNDQIWGPLMARSAAEVREWTLAHQGGRYPAAPMYAVMDLPYFDPSIARVPGLVIHGQADDRQDTADARALAADFGPSGAEFVSLADAGHIPRVEPPPVRDRFWRNVLDFLAVERDT